MQINLKFIKAVPTRQCSSQKVVNSKLRRMFSQLRLHKLVGKTSGFIRRVGKSMKRYCNWEVLLNLELNNNVPHFPPEPMGSISASFTRNRCISCNVLKMDGLSSRTSTSKFNKIKCVAEVWPNPQDMINVIVTPILLCSAWIATAKSRCYRSDINYDISSIAVNDIFLF